jgi:hypothetical protein
MRNPDIRIPGAKQSEREKSRIPSKTKSRRSELDVYYHSTKVCIVISSGNICSFIYYLFIFLTWQICVSGIKLVQSIQLLLCNTNTVKNFVIFHCQTVNLKLCEFCGHEPFYSISDSGVFLGTSLPPTPSWSRFDLYMYFYSIVFNRISNYTLYFMYCIITL